MSNEDDILFRREVLLSVQRALWDMVTPPLRGVSITHSFPTIRARFLYDYVSDEEREITSEAETYMIADFLPPVTVRFEAVALPIGLPRELEEGEIWAYLRREE